MKALIALLLLTGVAHAQAYVTAYKTGEEITGMTKQCYYSWAGNRYVHTVRATELCPLTLRVRI